MRGDHAPPLAMKTIKITKAPGAFEDVTGVLVSPMPGNEIPVSDETAKAMIEGGFAEEVETEGGPDATPTARQRAEELGVELASVEGTGEGGRITVEDVQKAAGRGEETS